MFRLTTIATLALAMLMHGRAAAQAMISREDQTVYAATAVLNEIMAAPVTRIPQYMLADAQGVAIVPNVLKGGFVVGVRHGRGVVVVRDEHGNWQPPQFISLTGGSVGWQAGVQATDVVLVFKTAKSVQNLLRGKFTIGVDAAAAAGPVGREASAATDATLKAEIYSYSRSRGLFAGVSLDGSALQVDAEANQAYYAQAPAAPGAAPMSPIPASALKLMGVLAQYTAPAGLVDVVPPPTASHVNAPAAPADSENLRRSLHGASVQLSAILDDAWRRHLALPAEIHSPMGKPNAELLAATVSRFDRVVADERYRALSQRPEFRATHELLKQYQQSLVVPPAILPNLPPPPTE